MYKYSPIKEIYIKNFRNIGEAVIDFNESPIVCLVGENEAGKTSVIKAFEVCALHANPREQKNYIRDGTKMFGIAIKLEDGTIVKRVKMDTVNKYAVEKPDGTVWDTAKLAEGLPIEVQNVMGLIEEPETKEFLHVRTYEDKMLFVVTPASTNYKVMYDALKVDQLTRAIKNGSIEANALRSEINSNEDKITAFTTAIRGIKIYDISILQKVRDRLVNQLSLLDKLDRAMELKKNIDRCRTNLGSLSAITDGTLKEIDVNMASKLSSVNRLINKKAEIVNSLQRMEDARSLCEIDTSQIERLKSLIDKKELLHKKFRDAEALVQLNKLSEIDEFTISRLLRAVTLNERLKACSKVSLAEVRDCTEVTQDELNVLNKLSRVAQLREGIKYSKTAVGQIEDYIKQVNEYIKQCGVAVTTCPNCGESVVIDKDLIE